MGLGFARDFCKQIEQDIPIWESQDLSRPTATGPRRRRDQRVPRVGAAVLRGGNRVRSLNYDELFIGGRWQAPSTKQRLSVISPHTEESIGETPEASPEDVDRAVRSARTAFDEGPWPRLSVGERMEKIEKLAAIYTAETDEMADLITAEMGSPRSFSRLGQATGAVAQMHLNMATAREFPWVERRPGLFGEVHLRRAPVGVVGAIVPWNVPQFLIMPKMIPALIAGCTVVVKPAPKPLWTPCGWRRCWRRSICRRAWCRSFPAAGRPATPWSAIRAWTRSRSPARRRPADTSLRCAVNSSSG